MRLLTRALTALAAVGIACATVWILRGADETPSPQPEATGRAALPADTFKRRISYEDAKPVIVSFATKLPAELQGRTDAEIEAAWLAWVERHDTDVRERLPRGDEDSIVNFWLYGTTFTTLPRATDRDLAKSAASGRAEQLLLGRLDDLVAGLASPGANDRLRFARQVIDRRGIDPTTPAGKDQARTYLVQVRERVVSENERYRRTWQSASALEDERARLNAYAAVYRERGLSTDTSIAADFAIERALEAARSQKRLEPGSVRRVAIVGPGLDFTDKAEGYDFYPQQTIQPFAIIDSLIRLGLAKADDLRLTTFDLSPRVNQHLEAARQRALAGDGYILQLPLDTDDHRHQWDPALVSYWQQFGDRIGDDVAAIPAPPGAAGVRVRAVRVRPAVVTSITPYDLNIVLERLEPLPTEERFDLIVATNVLVYYDTFDQALALVNISRMLRPGGFFLTNYAVTPTAPLESSPSLVTKVYWDRQHNGDTLLMYRVRH